MRKNIKASVSVMALAMGVALSATTALAADPVQEAMQDNWYVSVFGGASFARAQASYNESQYDIRLNDGFSVGAAIGRHVGNGFRTESELSYVRNSHDEYTTDDGAYDPDMNGDTDAIFLLGNLWKDIRLSDSVQPYIGGGLGTALLSSEESDEQNWDDSAIALAGQLGAGVRVAVTDRMALDAGYRLRAVVDASLQSVDGDDNGVFSFYSHSAQLGLSYALGEGSQAMPSGGGDPSNWYVSLFGGGVHTRTIWNYSDYAYSVEHDTGFTIGGAIGTHLAPGLRTELEISYLRSALDSYSTADGDDDPASGHLEQGFLLGNIWKDFQVGGLTPYIGGGLGFGLLHLENGDFDGDTQTNDTGYGLAGQFGFGARMAVSDNLSVDLGYRFKSLLDVSLIGGGSDTDNSDVSTHNHVAQLGLNYGLGQGSNIEPTSGVPDTRYVSLFGGGVFAQDTHMTYSSVDYMAEFKAGFTIGAAIGENLTENLRGEVEVAFQTYDVDGVDDAGTPLTDTDGTINSYFLLANLWRDFDMGAFQPYVGGGLGMAFMDVDISYDTVNEYRAKGTDVALAAQVGSGVRFPVTDSLTLDAGYRFKAAMGVFSEGWDGDNHMSASHYTHVGQIGASWKF